MSRYPCFRVVPSGLRLLFALAMAVPPGAAFAADAPAAGARSNPAVHRVPLPGRDALIATPAGWTFAGRQTDGRNLSIDILPDGQTAADWTERLGVVVVLGAGAAHPEGALGFLRDNGADIARSCASGPLEVSLGPVLMDGYAGHAAIHGCAALSATLGVALVEIAILVEGNIVLLRRAARGAPFAGDNAPITRANAPALMQSAFPMVRVCDPAEAMSACMARPLRAEPRDPPAVAPSGNPSGVPGRGSP